MSVTLFGKWKNVINYIEEIMMQQKMKVEDNKRNEETCKDFCGSCPSHPGSGEWLFCVRRKSLKEIQRNGCLCPSCQVYIDHNLRADYFCAIEPSE